MDQKMIDRVMANGTFRDPVKRQRVFEEVGFKIGKKADYAIIAGCGQPEAMPHVLRAFKQLLDHLKVSYTMLAKEYCCGWAPLAQPAVIAKNDESIARAKEVSAGFIVENFRQAEALGAKTIALFCAACEPIYTNYSGTKPEVISYSELLARHFTAGLLNTEIDYYAGCYRFRRRMTSEPVNTGAALQLLSRVRGLKVNHVDNRLCCYIDPHMEQLTASLKTKTVATICTGCYAGLQHALKDKGGFQVKMLPELLLESVRGEQ